MVGIAEVAEVRMRGGDLPKPGSEQEELVISAWQMYRWVSARAMREGQEMTHLNTDGHTWQGNLEDAAHDLWRAGKSPLKDTDWLTSYQTIKNWLLFNKNVVTISIGHPDIKGRRTGMIASKRPSWWVRDKFAGAPAGMKLPDLDDSGKPAVLLRVPTPPQAGPAPGAGGKPDWWCPFIKTCPDIGPYTEQGMREHVIRHGFKPGNGMFSRVMNDAAALREDRVNDPRLAPPPPPPPPSPPLPPVEDDPPARSILDIISDKREPAPAPAPPAPVPAAPPPVQPSARTGGIAVQARVYADAVAELESEVVALRRRNAELEAEVRRIRVGQREVRLDQQDIDAIAHRTAALLRSKDGN